MPEEIVFDAWSPMSFKRSMGSRQQGGTTWLAPTWVGYHARRLQAYKILQAYIDNSARFFLQTTDLDKRDNHREYGDAELISAQILAALLGEEQGVVVPGAEDFQDGEDAANDAETAAAKEMEDWIRQWGDDERLPLKVIETERNAVNLGDGLYTLGWSGKKNRPRLRVFDPGFYFPVLVDGNEDDFPERVHVAWELPQDPDDVRMRDKIQVRRLTWELVEGESRSLPWNDKPTTQHCLMSDATWTIDVTDRKKVYDFSRSGAVFEKTEVDGRTVDFENIDLGVDFLPVIHMPNTVAIINHFGRSSLSIVLQILDDLANADTDLQAASATTGNPVIALGGATLGDAQPGYRPGEVFETGDGTMTVLDTSRSLDALIKYVEFLLKRLSVNSRLPEALLGRVDPGKVPSGIAIALTFGPLGSMVKQMRLVRAEKYPLLLKFVWRMATAAGMEGVPVTFVQPELEFGSFLPSDEAAAVAMVTQLLEARAISLETAVAILVLAGLPIEDATEEVQRIQSRDFAGATQLLDATGDETAVFDYLDRDQPAGGRPQPPPIPTPPTLPGERPPGPSPAPPQPLPTP